MGWFENAITGGTLNPENGGAPVAGASGTSSYGSDTVMTKGSGSLFSDQRLTDVLVNMFNSSFSGKTDPFTQVGNASDIINVNQAGTGMATTTAANLGQRETSPQRGVNAALASLLGGELPGFMSGIADTAAQAAGNIYSGANALYSGPAQENISRAATTAVGEQTNAFLGNLLGASQGFGQTQAGMQQTGATILGSLGAQEYFNPTYASNPFFLSPTQGFALDRGTQYDPMQIIQGGLSAGANLLGSLVSGGII